MRKINTILVLIMMILMIDHIIFGGLHLFGVGSGVMRPLAISLVVIILLHALVSMYLTLKAEKVGFKTNARYNKENKEFWSRRVSGVLILVFALIHAYMMFFKDEMGRPKIATMPKIFRVITPLLVLSIYWHLIINVRPILISLGIKNIDKKERIIKFILTIIMLFALLANIYNIIKRSLG